MPQIDVPRLYRNRCGVWCFRLRSGTADSRVSLRTKCELTAHILARQFNGAIDAAKGQGMTSKNPNLSDLNIDFKALRRYELDLKNGVAKANGQANHDLMAWRRSTKSGSSPAVGQNPRKSPPRRSRA